MSRGSRWLAFALAWCGAGACQAAPHPRPDSAARVPSVAADAAQKASTPKASLAEKSGSPPGAPALHDALNEREPEHDPRFFAVDAAIARAIAAANMPGCVFVVGRHDEVLLRRAYGSRAIFPTHEAMTLDTVFDVASLTKPLATATSVMILAERGKIDLRAPASRYVSELARLPPFTVEQLLLHTSGLPAATPLVDYTDRSVVMARLAESVRGRVKARPGEHFSYSDVGFVVLDEIVRRRSGRDLAAFAKAEIWDRLGMTETSYLPSPELRARAAPTEQRDGAWMKGDVHDPRAFALGGVAGHAGVFSTADDLAKFAQAMLARAAGEKNALMSDKTYDVFVARHATTSGGRALGWDVDSRFATNKSPLLSPQAFGHGGFTGTALWIDPMKDLFVVFLSNRVHPDGKGAVNGIISEATTLAIDAGEVKTGIDVLRAESFERLWGAHVGLVTNTSARAKDGTTTIDAFRAARGVTLSAIFSPEHGIEAGREGKIGDSAYHGVPIFSLYGERPAPTAPTLADVDTLVFDLQDAGVRFYTYASTMKQAMRVASERKLRFVVLDRPNPIGGLEVAGPVFDGSPTFVNHHPLPVRHGMTMGELAGLFAKDEQLDLPPDVVRMKSWRRKDYFDHTGLVWSSPSPNLRSVSQVVLYPALGLLESTNLSVGRGTATPFEVIGAPFIDGDVLAKEIDARAIAGLAVVPTTFTPAASVHRGKRCGGVRLRVTDRAAFDPIRAALVLAQAIHAHFPAWNIDDVDKMLANAPALAALKEGRAVEEIVASWAEPLRAFVEKREAFLLYR